MAVVEITNPFGIGKATAGNVEDQPRRRRTSSVQTLEPPEEAGRSAAEAGVEVATRLQRR